MQRKPGILSAVFLIFFLILPVFAPILDAQTAPSNSQLGQLPTPQELDQLLSPIALFPDPLLAQMTTAATDPQQILDVCDWLAENPTLTGPALTDAAQQMGFDPAFLALVTFPNLIQMMADNINDFAAIGQAVMSDQASVAASIQRLRNLAYSAGALQSNRQQTVEVQGGGIQQTIIIQPANPKVVFVPQYDPTVVFAPQQSASNVAAASLISFGAGIGIGALVANNQPWGWGGWGWGWGPGVVYFNRSPWGGWHGGYRSPHVWFRPRPVVFVGRPGFGGNWNHRPRNWRPPSSGNRPRVHRPGNRPGQPNRPGGPNNRPPNIGGPGGNRPGQPNTRPPNTGGPGGNRPGQPNTRPPNTGGPGGNRPGQPNTRPPNTGAPGGNRPGQPNTRPPNTGTPGGNRPGQPNTRPPNTGAPGGGGGRPATTPRPAPQTRPSNQGRPANQSRPAPQGRPPNSGGNRGGQGQQRGGGPN